MATSIARLSRRGVTSNLIRRCFAAEAALARKTELPKPQFTVSPSTDRVKWDYRGQRQIIPLGQWLPKVAVDAYVAPNVVLAGQVTVWDGSSVWNGAVLRGDLNKITVGFCSNVQERCVVHAAWSSPTGCNGDKAVSHGCELVFAPRFRQGKFSRLPAATIIDRYVTVGAYSLLRSCTIEPECIIGQHSILMEGSLVETRSILEAGSVVPPGRRIPSGELWGGNPARFIRTLTNEETLEIPKLAVAINHLSGDYFSEFLPYSTVYLEVEKFKKSLGIAV
ncbi:putative NADH:ubiquinone reductase (H(+)-translocating) [Arabidopsis thaliana]